MSDSIPGFGAFDKVERIRRGMWVHATSPRPDVGQTPHSVIHRHDKLTVRHYAADPEADKQPLPVVIVPSMINRAYIVDLEPGRSLVEGLANKGHDVYLIDWGIPGQEDADEDVGYVLLTLLHRSILRIRRHAGTRQVHLFGYCMGGTLTAMYTAVRPDPVASLCTLAAPIHFAKGGRFYDLVSPVEVEEAIRADGLVPVESMKPVFQLLDDALPLVHDQLVHAHAGDLVDTDEHRLSGLPSVRVVLHEVLRDLLQPDRHLNPACCLAGCASHQDRAAALSICR